MSGNRKSNSLSTPYLIIYNLTSACGWSIVLYHCINNIYNQSTENLWNDTKQSLTIVQSMAILEILHSIIGLVKSPWVTVFIQVSSRLWTLFFCMHLAPTAQTSLFTVLACTSWALVEIPRYLYYATDLMNATPYLLFWLRYSLFAILYPTGISGELGCLYFAFQYLNEQGTTLSPNLNILKYVMIAVAISYIPGSPTMYMHMVKARRLQFDKKRGIEKPVKKDK